MGVLCTPETLRVFPDPNTINPLKKALLGAEPRPQHEHRQSRFCLTLCTEHELFEAKIRGLRPEQVESAGGSNTPASHADLFGAFAIALDALESRRIGIVPTIYYSPTDIYGRRFTAGAEEVPGLNVQIIQRLNELREFDDSVRPGGAITA